MKPKVHTSNVVIVRIILMYCEKVDPTTGFQTNVIEGELPVCFNA